MLIFKPPFLPSNFCTYVLISILIDTKSMISKARCYVFLEMGKKVEESINAFPKWKAKPLQTYSNTNFCMNLILKAKL